VLKGGIRETLRNKDICLNNMLYVKNNASENDTLSKALNLMNI